MAQTGSGAGAVRKFAAGSRARQLAEHGCGGTKLSMDRKLHAAVVRKCATELVVPIEEGLYREAWLWFPDMSPAELEAWWSALENVESFWTERGRSTWPGTFVRADEDIQLSEVWDAAWNAGPYRARVEFNEPLDSSGPDSYLRKSDGTVFVHKGAFRSQETDRSRSDE